MGISILELVLRRLREEKFTADAAFPGQKYPVITETVAAVHIEKVDRSQLTVTIEIDIISPASLGGTQCELEALRATEILRWDGAHCVQNGCSYDGVAQVYIVPILATFTCVTEENRFVLGPGFQVYVGNVRMPYAVAFSAEQKLDHRAQYEMGEAAPIGIAPGGGCWEIRLEELIPGGALEAAQLTDLFEVKLTSDTVDETYYHCRWTSQRREFTREGLRRIRTGIAMDRQEGTS